MDQPESTTHAAKLTEQSVTQAKEVWVRNAFERHSDALFRYARRLLNGDLEGAREVVQETFLRLCRQDQFAVEGHLVEWLYTVCRNRSLDIKRKEQRMTTLTDYHTQTTPNANSPNLETAAEDKSEKPESMQQVFRLMQELPENQQEVIRLKFQGGLSYKEIARVTDLSVSNVGYLIHTGLKVLREKLRLATNGMTSGCVAGGQVLPAIVAVPPPGTGSPQTGDDT